MTDDADAAAVIAREAGLELLRVRREAPAGVAGRQLGDLGDATSQELIAGRLAERFPRDRILSEEAADDPARLDAERVWIVDPLDGTREYSEGRHDWAVHVALWERGDLVAGAVALPDEDLVLSSANPGPRPPRGDDAIRIAVSRSRPPAEAERVAAELGAELVPMGSAGYKTLAVVRGQVDAYVHAGGQYEWDSAAPVAVARAAGLHASRVDGSPLYYNGRDPNLPDLLVCDRALAPRILDAVGRADESDGVT